MRVTLPDQVAAAGDTLFVLEIEFPEARPAAEKIEVTTTGDIEALDLRGTGAGGSYEVHPGLQALHVPLRVTEGRAGEAGVKVDWTDHEGRVTSAERSVTLEPVAETGGGGAGAKLAVVGLLLAGLVALGVFVAPGLFGGGSVPDVAGKTLEKAREELEGAGYVVAVDRVPVDDRAQNGVVLRTEPKAGDKRKSGAEVRIQVGSLLVDVTSTIGLGEPDAVQALEAQGLMPIVRYADAERAEEVGRVMEQSPTEGDAVPLRTAVTVVVGRAPRGGFPGTGPDVPGPDMPGPDVPDVPGPDMPGPDVPDVPGPDAPGPDAPGPDAPGPDQPTPDQPGPDAPGPDQPMPDQPGPDAPGPDQPTPDQPGPDAPRPDQPMPDQPGPDAPGPDQPAPDQPGPDAPGPEQPAPDQPGPDAPGPDQPAPDQPGPDAPGPDQPMPDQPGPDAPGPDQPAPDQPGPDAPGPDQPMPDQPGPDAPGPDQPAPDQPGPDAPGPDQPEPDQPGPDAPGPDQPAPDQPGPDQPAPDTPKPPPAVERGTVPDVTGQSRMLAETLIRRAGLRYRVRLEETSEKPDGTVLRQEPAAGTSAPLESRVTLIVAKRPPERGVDVPDVVGKQLDEATRVLRSAGFLVRTETASSSGAPIGTVVAQDPPPGAEAPHRSWVILTVRR